MKYLLYIYMLSFSILMKAQMPETDIFIADIEIKNNLVKIEKAVKTHEHKGYDNQPFFLPGGKSILFSSESDSDHKVHIYQYDCRSQKIKQITSTKTNEYSPILSPDGKSISSVVVEEDSTQRVWLYDAVSGAKQSCLSEKTDSIGYYAWLGKDSILYYKLTDPHSLRVLDLKTGEDNWLCDHPTRSFKKIKSNTFFYVIQEERQNLIFFYDVRTKKASLFAADKAGNQDYAWQPLLGLVKSEQSKLYHYSTETKVWAEVADFAPYGITKITRFAFGPDCKKLALVSNPEVK